MAASEPVLGPGLYVHLPFCQRKCFYCDFTVHTTKPAQRRQRMAAYVDHLLAEAKLWVRQPHIAQTEFHTLFFGGGTPSLLPPALFSRLLTGLRAKFQLRSGAEITLEANPEDLQREKLAAWLAAGVNRLSIGVQSFDPDLLTALGRVHSAQQARQGYQAARQAGFNNINLDLMFGLPDQTLGQWRSTLEQVLSLAPLPDHLSAYGLQVEPHTLFWRRQQEGRLPLPSEETQLAMLELSMEYIPGAGYEHYEISNFAQPQRRSQHNWAVWRFYDYLGLGTGAWSFWQGQRWGNEGALLPYGRLVEQGRLPVALRDEPRQRRTAMAEMVMLGTRLRQGLSLAAFRDYFGEDLPAVFPAALQLCQSRRWVSLTDGYLRLTTVGLPLANEVWLAFLD